jgi:hypothetical protein
MLTDVLGIRLLVLMGDPIPLPPPVEALGALTSAEVVQQDDGDGFQLTFVIAKDQLLDFPLLRSGQLGLFSRVVVGVVMGAIPTVLINGVITHHELQPSHEPGQSTLTITGRDVSVMMDLEERNASYKNTPDFLIATQVVARYAKFGVVPPVIGPPTLDIPFELLRIPQQAETDLQFLNRLARRNGFVFHINAVAPGVSQATFAPELRVPSLSSALTMDSITGDNVESLHFTLDGLAPVKADTAFLEPISKRVFSIPSPPSLRLPPLVAKPTPARRVVNPRNSAQETPTGALARAAAVVNNAPESVTGTGEVDTVRYGSVLQARKLVGVRGVGLSYDGFYYLRQVTHHIEVGEDSSYTQSFVMTREGTTSLLPVVVP